MRFDSCTPGFVSAHWGYGMARRDPQVLYRPPCASHDLAAVLMLPVFPLLLAAYFPGRIKARLQHPMLIAVVLWSLAHLLVRATLAGVLLFGAFLFWALGSPLVQQANAAADRDGASSRNDAIAIVAGLALYRVFVHWLHLRWIGIAHVPM